jgi:hypothetical protein
MKEALAAASAKGRAWAMALVWARGQVLAMAVGMQR